ncbi:MAG TPA: hypothetical protein PKA53_03025 [Sphingobacterium sp.]|nr:hypothetical protein [Sphingobacterium sp.]
MKRILLALVLATVSTAMLSSCTKEYYEMVPSKTFIYEKTATRYPWEDVSDNSIFFTLPINELTQYYVNQGIVSVAISPDNESTYQTIPATIGGISYSYDYQVGLIRVYAEDPIMEDGSFVNPPNNLVIKVSLTDADWIE